jgi:hypothetical protein
VTQPCAAGLPVGNLVPVKTTPATETIPAGPLELLGAPAEGVYDLCNVQYVKNGVRLPLGPV